MANTLTPRGRVAGLEAHPALADGEADRFAGYGVLGIYFPSASSAAVIRARPSSRPGR